MSRPLPKAGVRMCRVIGILLDAGKPMTVDEVMDQLAIRYEVFPVHSTVWAELTTIERAGLATSEMLKNTRGKGRRFTLKMVPSSDT